MNQNTIKIAVSVIITLVLSLYLGVGAASAQSEVLKVTGVAALLALLIGFGRRIWLLIPLTMLSSLSFRWMPGQWRATDLAFLITILGCFLLFMTRRLDYKFKLRFIHIFACLVVLTVAQVYLRNPVGLAVFGSSSVGGRAYFTFGVALIICVIFSFIRVPSWELFLMRKFILIGGIFTVLAQWLSYVPGLALPLALGLGTGNVDFEGQGQSSGMAGRNLAGADTSRVLSRITVSFISPMKALLLNRWTLIVMLAVVGGMISGFRSKLADGLLILTLGIFYWQGIRAVLAAFLIGVCGLMCLAILNLMLPLPAEAQRALSFLPGTWEEQYVREADDSTDWRLDMWKEALFTDRWIKNKMLGDGLGFDSKELELQNALKGGKYEMAGFGNLTSQQVSFLINGDYHSGPVSFVRTVGYIGLAVFGIGLFAVAVAAHRLLKRVRGTPYFGVVAIICIPAIAHPLIFFLIFGTFSGDISQYFLNIGLISFLSNNIDFQNIHEDPREMKIENSGVETT